MPSSPDVVLAVLGAIFLLVAMVGRIEAEKLRIGLSTSNSRVLAALLGIACLSLSVYLRFYHDTAKELPQTVPIAVRGDTEPEIAVPASHVAQETDGDEGSAVGNQLAVEGQWNVTVSSKYQIVWKLKASLQGDQFCAFGPKIFVEGKAAQPGEKKTTLILQGRLSGSSVKGRYTENQPTRQTSGKFEFTFSSDGALFTGVLFTPSGQGSSDMLGVKVG